MIKKLAVVAGASLLAMAAQAGTVTYNFTNPFQPTEISQSGTLGLFDGAPSSADLAACFGVPVLALINAHAMAQTFGALAYGLAHYRPGLPSPNVPEAEGLRSGMKVSSWSAFGAKRKIPRETAQTSFSASSNSPSRSSRCFSGRR